MSDGRVELWAANPLGRFSDRADDYARYRPTYPAAAVDAVLEGLGSQVVAADVGAGTGISAALLAERGGSGARVIAIEPNAAMRQTGARFISGRGLASRVEWREGTAEATGLEAGSVDVVLCAQAFHWFRAAEALAEFARVLRPGGRIALMWNDKDLRDDLTRGYGELVEDASGRDPAAADHVRPDALYRSGLFTGVRELRFTHEQRLDAGGLLGRAMSASYVPKQGQAAEKMKRGLADLHARFADAKGEVSLVYETVVYVGERASVIDWSRLPMDLDYLKQPAERLGEIGMRGEHVCAQHVAALSEEERSQLEELATRIRLNGHGLLVSKYLDDNPITDHKEAALLYFTMLLLDIAGLDLGV